MILARLRLMLLALAAFATFAACAPAALAAGHVKVVLKNGDKIEGEVEGHTADGIRVRPDADGAPAAVQEIRDGEIKSIEFKERESYFWLAFGLCGNLVWGSRFLYQWYVSEKAGKSVIPEGFWYISMVGSIVFLIFSIHLMFAAGWRDATPILLGYVFNTIPYARNLMLIHKEKKKLAAEGAADRPRPVGTGSPQDVEAARS